MIILLLNYYILNILFNEQMDFQQLLKYLNLTFEILILHFMLGFDWLITKIVIKKKQNIYNGLTSSNTPSTNNKLINN